MPQTSLHGCTSQDRWVRTPGGRVFARLWQPPSTAVADRPVLLFHDSLGCVRLWRDFPAALAARLGRTVIAYDRLGFGRSDPRSDRPGLDFIAAEAVTALPALREQLEFDRYIAFGHSVGGGMAVHCAALEGGGCEALITEAAQVFVEDRTLQGIVSAKAHFEAPGQLDRLVKSHGDKAAWVLAAWVDSWLDPRFADWSLEPILPRVRVPTLAIHGVYDEFGSTLHPDLISRLTSGPGRCEVLPDTHHVPHREHQHRVLDLVEDFLATQLPDR